MWQSYVILHYFSFTKSKNKKNKIITNRKIKNKRDLNKRREMKKK